MGINVSRFSATAPTTTLMTDLSSAVHLQGFDSINGVLEPESARSLATAHPSTKASAENQRTRERPPVLVSTSFKSIRKSATCFWVALRV